VDDEAKYNAINKLIENNRLLLWQTGSGNPVYKYQSEEDGKKLKDLDQEDILAYNVIQEAGNKGITVNDIKVKVDALKNSAIINRVLKKLEKQKGLVSHMFQPSLFCID
jgi:hypothetical protein